MRTPWRGCQPHSPLTPWPPVTVCLTFYIPANSELLCFWSHSTYFFIPMAYVHAVPSNWMKSPQTNHPLCSTYLTTYSLGLGLLPQCLFHQSWQISPVSYNGWTYLLCIPIISCAFLYHWACQIILKLFLDILFSSTSLSNLWGWRSLFPLSTAQGWHTVGSNKCWLNCQLFRYHKTTIPTIITTPIHSSTY